MSLSRSLSRVGLASLVGALLSFGAARAEAANPCDPAALTCSKGSAKLEARIKSQLPTQIDSGMMDKGAIKIRTRFTIDPVGSDPLLAIDMQRGALVEASWNEKGYVDVHPVPEQGAQGTMSVHYTLTPSLEASIYGIGVSYDAAQLVNKLPGGKFNYDAKGASPIQPWGFAGASVTIPAPPLDQSTIFTIPFSQLGVSTGIAEGTLSIQAAANPTFRYVTKDVRLDAASITSADGSAKIAVGDADFLDVTAMVAGELSLAGNLDVRPVVKVDSVDGYPTFGLVKFAFTAVSKPLAGAPIPVGFANTEIHIPLPNVKVPATPVNMGTVKPGQQSEQTVSIDSTGEMDGRLTFTSSDPQFTVPSGEVRVGSKSKHALKVVFKPNSDGAASATITVRSNDPDSPEQTFRVAANGASLDPRGEDDGDDGTSNPKRTGGVKDLEPPPSDEGCACATVGAGSLNAYAALALGLGLAVVVRRRRRR
jgi:MYXO-CTERM domain-containing protein